jgi:hypothetical protein
MLKILLCKNSHLSATEITGKISLVQYEGMRLGSMEENESIRLTIIASRLADLITVIARLIFEPEISFWSPTHYRDAAIQTQVSCEDAMEVGAVQNEESLVDKPIPTPAKIPAASHYQLSLLPCQLPVPRVINLNQ